MPVLAVTLLVLCSSTLAQAGIGRGLLASLPEVEVTESRDVPDRCLGTLDDEITRVRKRLSTVGSVR